MARQKGSASFAGTLEVLAGGPLDARSQVPTKADLTVVSNFPYPYVGMQVYVIAEGKRYTLKAADVTVLANWEVEGGETDGGHTIEDPEGTALTQRDTLQFGGDLEVSDDDENEKTVVAPHELTTEELAEIMSTLPGQPTQGITIDLRGNERVVGKVIESDGTEKTLYQKTIMGTMPTIASGETVGSNAYAIGSNIDKCVLSVGFVYSSSEKWDQFFPLVNDNGTKFAKLTVYDNNADSNHKNKVYISSTNNGWAGSVAYVTLQYTKTTS